MLSAQRLLTVASACFALTSCAMNPAPAPGPHPVYGVYSPYFRPATLRTLAIYVQDHTGRLGGSAALHQVEDEFIRAALNKGYTLAARSDLDRIASEAALQDRGIIENAAAKSARALGVSGVLVVSIDRYDSFDFTATSRVGILTVTSNTPKYRTEVSVSARLIDAELGQIVWCAASHDGQTFDSNGSEATVPPYVASAVAGAIPSVTESRPSASYSVSQAPAGGSTMPDIDRIAIYVQDRSGRISSEGWLRIVENSFIQTTLRRGYIVVARSDLNTVIREIAFQNSGAVDAALARAGRVLGVPAVVLVSVDRYDVGPYQGYPPGQTKEVVALSARVVSTDRAADIWQRSVADSTWPDNRQGDPTFLSFSGAHLAGLLESRPVPGWFGRPQSSPSVAAGAPADASAAIVLRGRYVGDGKDSSGPGKLTFDLVQNGEDVTGTMIAASASGRVQFRGDFAGKLRGSTLSFTVTILPGGVPSVPDCAITLSGVAKDVTIQTISAIYAGTSTCSKPFNDGHFTVARR